jgi:hypothetical protein
MYRLAVLIALILVTTTACANGSTGSGGNPGLAAADAQATLAIVQVQQQQAAAATRESSDATAAAYAAQAQATQAAANQATAEAVAVAQAQAATAESLAFLATAQALNFEATEESYAIASTAQAVQQIATAEAAIVADEARRLEIARQAEIAAIERGRLWNTVIYPAIALLLALAGAAFLATLAYRLYQRSRPAQAHQVGDRILILAGNNQPYQIGPRITAPEPLALTAGEPVARPSTLPALATGHVLIAGETGSGKTTAMQAVLRRRQNVVVLDPHDDQKTWGHAHVIGGGGNFEAIKEYLAYMDDLLSERMAQRYAGQERFEQITIATDEMPALVAEIGREVYATFRRHIRQSRKFDIELVVSTQSTRVKTLGIEGEGDLLENFRYVLVLGKLAEREYPDLMRDAAPHTAVLRTQGGARPVVIPHVEARPSNGNGHQPFILPAPVYADPENMTHADKARIRYMLREGFSQRAIEKELYGYNGGKAYTAVKQVKDDYDDSELNVEGAIWGAI